MFSRTSEEEVIQQLSEELPHLIPNDVLSLITSLKKIQDNKQKNFFAQKKDKASTADWVPHRTLVKEILALGIEPCFIPQAIEDFLNFASTKDWTPQDNLNSKFITHVKFLISCGRITTTQKNTESVF